MVFIMMGICGLVSMVLSLFLVATRLLAIVLRSNFGRRLLRTKAYTFINLDAAARKITGITGERMESAWPDVQPYERAPI